MNEIRSNSFTGWKLGYKIGSSFEMPLLPSLCPKNNVPIPRSFPKEAVGKTEDALKRRDYETILENPDLSQYVYCKAIDSMNKPINECFSFNQHKLNSRVQIVVDEQKLDIIEKQIEIIRKIFHKYFLMQDNFILLEAEIVTGHVFLDVTHKGLSKQIKEFEPQPKTLEEGLPSQPNDVSKQINILESKNFYSFDNECISEANCFERIVLPALSFFALQLNMCCNDYTQYLSSLPKNRHLLKIKNSYEFIWPKKPLLIYPITPLEISHSQDFPKSMYPLYKEEKFCDLTLHSGDKKMKLHSTILYINGGDAMKAMLTQNMKEAQEKCIIMDDFSLDTLKTFVDYLYLGPKILEPEVFFEEEHNLEELFALAHQYQIQPLLDCCTNLFTLTYTTDQVEELTKIADLYDNSQLKALAEQYRKNSPKQEETE